MAAVAGGVFLLLVAGLVGALVADDDPSPTPTAGPAIAAADAAFLTALATLPPTEAAWVRTSVVLPEGYYEESPDRFVPVTLPPMAAGPTFVALGEAYMDSSAAGAPAAAADGPIVLYTDPHGGPGMPLPSLWVGGEVTVVRRGVGGTPTATETSPPSAYVVLQAGDAVVVPAGVPFVLGTDEDAWGGGSGPVWVLAVVAGDRPPAVPGAPYVQWYVWGTATLPAGPLVVEANRLPLAPGQSASLEATGGPLLVPLSNMELMSSSAESGPPSLNFIVAGGAARLLAFPAEWFGESAATAAPDALGGEMPVPQGAEIRVPFGMPEEVIPPPIGLFAEPGATVTLRLSGDDGIVVWLNAIAIRPAEPAAAGTPSR